MNSYFKRYLNRKLLLYQFVAKYEEAVLDRRETEIAQDLKSRQSAPPLKSRWKVEKEAAERYTQKMFKRFQDQLVEAWNLFDKHIEDKGTMVTYHVTSFGNRCLRKVTFDSSDSTVKCSCRGFEFTGMSCEYFDIGLFFHFIVAT